VTSHPIRNKMIINKLWFMFKINLNCDKSNENKVSKSLEKFGQNFQFIYTVMANDQLEIEFFCKNLSARNEIVRRLKHIKGFKILSMRTEKGEENG